MWVSPVASRGRQRLALAECPVSAISGESVAFVEDFLAHVSMQRGEDLTNWTARRVDAFSTLYAELREWKKEQDGE